MSTTQAPDGALVIRPATADRWDDMQRLFGPRGACGGCWCMWWRLKRSEFDRQKGEGNRAALQAIVESGQVLGLLAYDGERAVGWCALGPREQFPVLERSRVLKPVDDTPVWSAVCFYVDPAYRQRGLSLALLKGAIDHVHAHGGRVIEGYPVEPRKERVPAVFVFTGLASTFRRAGFVEVARRSDTRPIMRYVLPSESSTGAASGAIPIR
jgi:GNAT superfamily N-acetyltransferase